GRRHLRANLARPASVHPDRVIVWSSNLIGVGELQLSILRLDLDVIDLGHEGHVAVVSHPDRWLVCPDEPRDRCVFVLVRDAAHFILTSLRSPVRHTERWRHKWHRPAIADRTAPCADVRIHPVNRVRLHACRQSQRKDQCRGPQAEHFAIHRDLPSVSCGDSVRPSVSYSGCTGAIDGFSSAVEIARMRILSFDGSVIDFASPPTSIGYANRYEYS